MSWKKLYGLLRLTVVHFIDGNISSFASALTYNTLLASVPVLAIAFAIARGFGFDEMVETKIHQVLDFSPETATQVIGFVNSYLQHTKGGVFVGVGIAVLMYTVVNLTINIETAFNQIWWVKSSRSLYRQISDYISVFILMPLLFIITSGLSVLLMTFAQMFGDMLLITNTVHWMLYLSPYIITSFSFILLYKLMPNTQVKWRYCIVPGIIAAILFQGMAYFYVHYQIKISSYNAIYGSFAGIALTVFNLVPSVTNMLGKGALTCVTSAYERGDRMSLRNSTVQALFVTAVIAVPAAVGLGILPNEVLGVLFSEQSDEVAVCIQPLRLLMPAMVCLCMSFPLFSMLQAVGEASAPLKIMLLGTVLKLIGNALLIPQTGVEGAAISTSICYGVIFAVSLRMYLKRAQIKISTAPFVKVLYSGAMCGGTAYVTASIMRSHGASAAAVILVSGAAGGMVYISLLYTLMAVHRVRKRA